MHAHLGVKNRSSLTGKGGCQRPSGLHGLLELAVERVIGLPNGKNGVDPVQDSRRV